MSIEDNKSLLRRYIDEVLNEGRLDKLDDLLSPQYTRYLSPTAAPLTAEAQKQRLAGLRAAFPDIHLTIEDLIAEGDRVVCRLTLRGTHQGTFLGIAPTHRQVTFSGVDVIRIENGRFAEHWGGPDLVALVQQLGGRVGSFVKK